MLPLSWESLPYDSPQDRHLCGGEVALLVLGVHVNSSSTSPRSRDVKTGVSRNRTDDYTPLAYRAQVAAWRSGKRTDQESDSAAAQSHGSVARFLTLRVDARSQPRCELASPRDTRRPPHAPDQQPQHEWHPGDGHWQKDVVAVGCWKDEGTMLKCGERAKGSLRGSVERSVLTAPQRPIRSPAASATPSCRVPARNVIS
jgi:hypothetical protein